MAASASTSNWTTRQDKYIVGGGAWTEHRWAYGPGGCAVNVWNVFERRGQVNNTTINCGGQYYKTIHTMLQHLVRSSIRVGRYYINGMVTFAQMYIHGHTTINYFWWGIISMGAGRVNVWPFIFVVCWNVKNYKLQIIGQRGGKYTTWYNNRRGKKGVWHLQWLGIVGWGSKLFRATKNWSMQLNLIS